MEEFIINITPGHVLAYATGASVTPAAGFKDHPRISFVHDDAKMLPAANTCSYELTLFANNETITNNFDAYLTKALMNGVVFSIL